MKRSTRTTCCFGDLQRKGKTVVLVKWFKEQKGREGAGRTRPRTQVIYDFDCDFEKVTLSVVRCWNEVALWQ